MRYYVDRIDSVEEELDSMMQYWMKRSEEVARGIFLIQVMSIKRISTISTQSKFKMLHNT